MSTLDVAIVLSAIFTAVLGVTRGRALRVASAILAVLCLAQWFTEGYFWHFLPVYLLFAVLMMSLFWWGAQAAATRRALRLAIAFLAFVVLASWVVVPVPRLPAPTGPHSVGTSVFRWIDSARAEPATDAPADRRQVIVQAWYPAESADGNHATYIDGIGRLPDRVAGIPRAVLAHYGRVNPHAIVDAVPLPAASPWPVVVFSPGYGASRAFYSTLVCDLASRGFMVLAIDHPYEAAITQLVDGEIVTTVERRLPNEPNPIPYMIRQTAVRAADIGAVIDQIGRPGRFGRLAAQMDGQRIAAVGHSFGGAASVAVAATDNRVRATVNIDGTLYGSTPEVSLEQPFLLIESDRAETQHGAFFIDGNTRLISRLRAAGYRYQLERSNHYSFSDAAFLLSPPARWMVSRLIGGSRGPAETVRMTNDLLVAFLTPPREAAESRLRAVESKYVGLRSSRISPDVSHDKEQTRP